MIFQASLPGFGFGIRGDGVSTSIDLDLRQLVPIGPFTVPPDSVVSAFVVSGPTGLTVSAAISGHLLTITFNSAIAADSSAVVNIGFGFSGR